MLVLIVEDKNSRLRSNLSSPLRKSLRTIYVRTGLKNQERGEAKRLQSCHSLHGLLQTLTSKQHRAVDMPPKRKEAAGDGGGGGGGGVKAAATAAIAVASKRKRAAPKGKKDDSAEETEKGKKPKGEVGSSADPASTASAAVGVIPKKNKQGQLVFPDHPSTCCVVVLSCCCFEIDIEIRIQIETTPHHSASRRK